MPLTTSWGQPAFIRNDNNFNIANHVVLGPLAFKSNYINELHVQTLNGFLLDEDLPSQLPGWKVFLVPVSSAETYLLIKVHRLLYKNRRELGEPLKGHAIVSQEMFNEPTSIKDFLMKLMEPPVNSIAIFESFIGYLSEFWYKFLNKHESLDKHEVSMKEPTNLTELVSSMVLIVHSTYRQYKHLKHRSSVINLWVNLMRAESERYLLSWPITSRIVISAMNPINVFRQFLKFCWWCGILWAFKIPLQIVCELEALHFNLFLNQSIPQASLIGFCLKYIPLLLGSWIEMLHVINLGFNLPRILIESNKKFEASR